MSDTDNIKADLTCDGNSIVKEAWAVSAGVGLLVAVATFGLFGHIQRKTFKNVSVELVQ